jgi:hypothetical protein
MLDLVQKALRRAWRIHLVEMMRSWLGMVD